MDSQSSNGQFYKRKNSGKRKFKKLLRALMRFLVLTIAAVINTAILSGIIAVIFWISFTSFSKNPKPDKVSYIAANGRTYALENGGITNSECSYVPLGFLSKLFDVSVMSDKETIVLFVPGQQTKLTAHNGSCVVLINDTSVRISEPIIMSGSEYYFPVSFFDNYTNVKTELNENGYTLSAVSTYTEFLLYPMPNIAIEGMANVSSVNDETSTEDDSAQSASEQ